jgi:probable HAF family extracellular repeat protein
MVGLGKPPGASSISSASAVNGDGSVIVGARSSASGPEAFRWTAAGGIVGLGTLPTGSSRPQSAAKGVSRDGSVVVGYSDSALGTQAFRWTSSGGMVGLGDLPGGAPFGFDSQAWAVSGDGSVVVGYGSSNSGQEAFRWTAAGGMVGLGRVGIATAVNGDGSVVVGAGGGAFRWTAGGGVQRLWDVMLANGVNPAASGWSELGGATGISLDGNAIVGYGKHNGNDEAFLAVLPDPAGLVLLAIAAPALLRRWRRPIS